MPITWPRGEAVHSSRRSTIQGVRRTADEDNSLDCDEGAARQCQRALGTAPLHYTLDKLSPSWPHAIRKGSANGSGNFFESRPNSCSVKRLGGDMRRCLRRPRASAWSLDLTSQAGAMLDSHGSGGAGAESVSSEDSGLGVSHPTSSCLACATLSIGPQVLMISHLIRPAQLRGVRTWQNVSTAGPQPPLHTLPDSPP